MEPNDSSKSIDFVIHQENERKSLSKIDSLKNLIEPDESEDIDVDVDHDEIEETKSPLTPLLTPPIEKEVLFNVHKAPSITEGERRLNSIRSKQDVICGTVMDELKDRINDIDNSTTDTTMDSSNYVLKPNDVNKSEEIKTNEENGMGLSMNESQKMNEENKGLDSSKTEAEIKFSCEPTTSEAKCDDEMELEDYIAQNDNKKIMEMNSELPSDAATEAGYTIYDDQPCDNVCEIDKEFEEKKKELQRMSIEIDSHILEEEFEKPDVKSNQEGIDIEEMKKIMKIEIKEEEKVASELVNENKRQEEEMVNSNKEPITFITMNTNEIKTESLPAIKKPKRVISIQKEIKKESKESIKTKQKNNKRVKTIIEKIN